MGINISCLSNFLSYFGNNSSWALLKYDVRPIIRRLNFSILIILPVLLSIKMSTNSSKPSGNALFTWNSTPVLLILMPLVFNLRSTSLIKFSSDMVPRSFTTREPLSVVTPSYPVLSRITLSNPNGFLVITIFFELAE